MKRTVTVVILLFLFNTAESQLNKATWLVGGTASFLASKNSTSSPGLSYSSNRIDIKVSPSIGYFIIDKFALGVRPSFTKYKDQVRGPSSINSNENRFEFGPFVRYYFLDAEKQYNILTDISYQYGRYWFKPTKGNINTFSASAGTVIYFNSVVGLELLLGYYSRKGNVPDNYETNQKGFQTTVGFQIHLEN